MPGFLGILRLKPIRKQFTVKTNFDLFQLLCISIANLFRSSVLHIIVVILYYIIANLFRSSVLHNIQV